MLTVNLNGIVPSVSPISVQSKAVNQAGRSGQNFADTLKTAIQQVNDAQVKSNKMTDGLAKGQVDNLHEVMIAAQKASITLETSVQIQRKVIDAYNEIMRMQV